MPFEYRDRFSRMMFLEMDALLGTEAAGDVSFEARGDVLSACTHCQCQR